MTPPKRQTSGSQNLTPKRLIELKARIKSDYYDSPDRLSSLADRLINSGDLGNDAD